MPPAPPLTVADGGLTKVLHAVFEAVAEIAVTLRSVGIEYTDSSQGGGGVNAFGDRQLKADVAADGIMFDNLRACGAVETASSEENTDMVPMGGKGFSVAFDPVDGSSIYPANWSVGTIFGIWPGGQMLGKKGSDQVAAGFSVYGPRTLLVLAVPGETGLQVLEYTLSGDTWSLTADKLRIPASKKIFAPANMRASSGNEAYRKLIVSWMEEGYTLRYSGGLVPDVYHIFAKGGGVFCNPVSAAAPAKLRLLYEVAPLAFVVEAAGGSSETGDGSASGIEISTADMRCQIVFGSRVEVERCRPAMKFDG